MEKLILKIHPIQYDFNSTGIKEIKTTKLLINSE